MISRVGMVVLAWMVVLCGGSGAPAQVAGTAAWRHPVANVVMPQAVRSVAPERANGGVRVTEVEVEAVVQDQVATVVMDVALENAAGTRQEAELLIPVPDGTVVRGFDFHGTAPEPTAVLLPKEEARKTYDSIVAKVRDPALLEFIGWNLVRSSVFPVEPRSGQRVRLTYEHVLPVDGNRVDLVLPRSESLEYSVHWRITVRIGSKSAVHSVYSPTHDLEIDAPSSGARIVRLSGEASREPGPFVLSWMRGRGDLGATVYACPSPEDGGGYFLLLTGIPHAGDRETDTSFVKREVVLVLDRSGSMAGEKLAQVRKVAREILADLGDGEAFNLVVYNEAVDLFSRKPVVKTRASLDAALSWLNGIAPRGGTNIHDALLEALRMESTPGTLPVVLFLTDGLPTIGRTSESAISDLAATTNPFNRRVFTIGVGADVNTPLLENLASVSRAKPTFIIPGEKIDLKVGRLFKSLSGPVLTDVKLDVLDVSGRSVASRTTDVVPHRLPDFFEGDQVAVLGRYVGEEPLSFVVDGITNGGRRRFAVRFDPAAASTRFGFVSRLWAARKIAFLADEIRRSGADQEQPADRARLASDPRFKELVEEIVALSSRFGILTEYTSFLAREGTDLGRPELLVAEAGSNFIDRAVGSRSGLGSLNQSFNLQAQMRSSKLNARNTWLDKDLNQVSETKVQQAGPSAFFNHGGRWVDGRLAGKSGSGNAAHVVNRGSREFGDLAVRLAQEGRQAVLALQGDVLVDVNGEAVLVVDSKRSH